MKLTKQEFIKYINSFHKDPGEYSKDDAYLIGIEHRKLLKKDKSWNNLVDLIGWNGSGESLRNYVMKKMKREGILPTNNRILTDKTVEEIDSEDLISLKKSIMKERQRTRDEWTTYRKLMREDARIDSLKEIIADSISSLKSLPDIKYNKPKIENKKEAILMLSDLHIGVKCDNFYNKYNVEIATHRVNKLVDDVIEYCNNFNVSVLNVVNLGDLIHGIIHINARIEEEIDVVDQVMVASEILSKALNRLQAAAPKVVYRSVVDNHSRLNSNKDESIESENLNRLIDWYVEERLKSTSIIFDFDNLDSGIGKFDLMNGKKIVFAHGHNDNINQAFQHFVGATEEFVHYILLGHYHCEKAKSYQGTKVLVNGSVVGTEQFALSKRLFSKPSQTLLIFDGDDNMINVSIGLGINE